MILKTKKPRKHSRTKKRFMHTNTAAKTNLHTFSEPKKGCYTEQKAQGMYTHAARVHYHTSKKVVQDFTIRQ